jgi:hypothetical protein
LVGDIPAAVVVVVIAVVVVVVVVVVGAVGNGDVAGVAPLSASWVDAQLARVQAKALSSSG